MTDISTCATCHYHRNLYLQTVSRHDHRCFRPHTIKGRAGTFTYRDGVSCVRERDSIPEPQRVDGDRCGPDGKHWTMREHV